jgi:hypothetical protein
MSKRPTFPTPAQELALNLAFAAVGESRVNRTADEYMRIAAKLPELKVLTFRINQLLRQFHADNAANPPELCRFKAGDRRIVYEPYPKSISYETVRAALEILGMRKPRWRKR